MIYFDNAATTLQKPPQVAVAVAEAINTFGNPGRSFYAPAMEASRALYSARQAVAELVGLADPLGVALTSGATESLNLAINSLIAPEDGVITTVLEHNSVLRPLYRTGCSLSLIDCDDRGDLLLDKLPMLVTEDTRYLVCTHGSNLVGSLTDAYRLKEFCRCHGLRLILDVSQTLGSVEVKADMADVLCFTGHKALMGPQGTGGIIVGGDLPFRLVKTGGSGSRSFESTQPLAMPDIFEAGTHNAHGLAGLLAGVSHISRIGIAAVTEHEKALTDRFLAGLRRIPGVTLYGPLEAERRLPVVSFNLGDLSSEDVALRLWEGWEIATRAGIHCAPLAHKRFGTAKRGMVRVSFGLYNTAQQVDAALDALRQMAEG